MAGIGRYSNSAMTVDWSPDSLPAGTLTESIALATPDRAATTGLLYQPAAPARGLVALMHPRVDFSRHYLIPPLLRGGYAVWAQRSRNVGNDLTTVHEQLLLDVATAHQELARRGFEKVFVLGNSGGASLYAFYIQQASRAPAERLTASPSGLRVDLDLPMPVPAGLILLAPHPGQGDLLLHCIDPSVAEESDPDSVLADLDLFSPENGFREPPESSSFDERFLGRYREAQRERVARIDASMRALIEAQAEQRRRGKGGDREARRQSLRGRFVVVPRTDADPRTVDLGLDPSDRDYGSIFGRRPDVTNFGAVGFGRVTTPHAWLSTWSGLSTNAALRLTLPEAEVPTLLLSYTADNSVFPSDIAAVEGALGTTDVTRADLRADHYGYAPGSEDRVPATAEAIRAWLDART